ncbi:MAG: helix-hairpin-helix domain-containing protein [Terracidiphilus sp.]
MIISPSPGILAVALVCALSSGIGSSAYQSPTAQPASQAAPAPEDRADLNSANLDQLMKVPGMTRTWAARIVRYRPYRTKNDLIDRGIVTNQVYDRIKEYVIAHRAKP